jgi:hypothetical protein
VITGLRPFSFTFTLNWTIFSGGTFLIIFLTKIISLRVTPSLKEHIKNEINSVGFKIQDKKTSWIVFLILNSISILLSFLIEAKMIIFNGPLLTSFLTIVFIIYMVIGLSIPIIWCFSYDGLIVKLKDKYQIFIHPSYKVQKNEDKVSQLIGIYLTSNKIAMKFNSNEKKIYKRIAEDRWLPRKRISTISKYRWSPFLKFYEFSTPSNLQKQFLNIIFALQEWDKEHKRGVINFK